MNRKNDTKAKETKKQEIPFAEMQTYDVQNVRDTRAGIFFTLYFNGVYINNCKVVEQEGKKDFIGMPSYKAKDGTYYNTVFIKLKDEDEDLILGLIEKILNAD